MEILMKKGLKTISLMAAVMLMCSSFVGCTGSEKTTADGEKTKISVGRWPSKEGKEKIACNNEDL